MRLNRLSLATLGVMAATAVCQAQQAYPAKSVKIMVGYAPGGSADMQTRLTARWPR
jgi:tripartite-type tricarboxylate transporter receptor subunit TctC